MRVTLRLQSVNGGTCACVKDTGLRDQRPRLDRKTPQTFAVGGTDSVQIIAADVYSTLNRSNLRARTTSWNTPDLSAVLGMQSAYLADLIADINGALACHQVKRYASDGRAPDFYAVGSSQCVDHPIIVASVYYAACQRESCRPRPEIPCLMPVLCAQCVYAMAVGSGKY